jgi:glucokinase
MMMNDNALRIGVDIGGTKVAAGLVDPFGEIIFKTRTEMVAIKGAREGLRSVTRAIDEVLEVAAARGTRPSGIGICAPGPLDPRTGVILNPPHVPCWRNYPLTEHVERAFDLPVRVDNDANAAALAEALWGAGKEYDNVFYVTLGTGIGTGIIFHRTIYYGRTGAAGEGGHTTIDYKGPKCACGKRGCLDVLCSGPAIAERARRKIVDNGVSRILELAGSRAQISSEHVGQAYREGDPVAAQVLQETADLVTIWLGNIADLLEPDVLILGGGVAALIEPYLGYIRETLPAWSVNPRVQEIPLVRARYGADAGIAGAAALEAER